MKRRSWLSLSIVLVACHVGPHSGAPVEQQLASESAVEVQPVIEAAPTDRWASASLERDVAHRVGITEVFLDPRGEAALTLDAGGGVRLWPQLTADASASAPYRIPVHEPLWLSLAKHEGGRKFTLGFIATNNAASVYQVELPASGPARIVESFSLSPEDPLLELHVLDGGQRILALGVDHRVRLYAADGRLLSVIDERSFGPWQLRVSGGVGEPPKLAAILAQPMRVQPLRLDGDRLEIAGPARTFELDRGPNQNDLALSPDGTTMAALRRAHKHGRQWSIELIDLATDTRKLIAGRADTPVRPRMHFDRDDRLLLESGSGKAWVVELGQAVEPRKLEDLHPDSKFAKRLAKRLVHASIDLPASSERDLLPEEDRGVRMHANVVNGVRAAVDVNGGRRLVVGPVDEPQQLAFVHAKAELLDAVFDASGSTVVWASSAAIYVDRIDVEEIFAHEHPLGEPVVLAVPKRDRAVIVGRSEAGVVALDSGELIERIDLPVDATPSWFSHHLPDGLLGYQTNEIMPTLWLAEYGASLQVRPADDELSEWDSRQIALYAETKARAHSPVGGVVAVAKPRNRGGPIDVSLLDGESQALWTFTIDGADEQATLRWSADGTRLAVITEGVGRVLDASDGSLLRERRQLPLEVRTVDASMPAPLVTDPLDRPGIRLGFAAD